MKKPGKYKAPRADTGKVFSKPRLHDTASWREYSVAFLQANPKCYACSKRSTVTDHVVTAKGDEDKFWNRTNFIPLCKPCHDTITAKFDRSIPPNTEGKMLWIHKKRVETETYVKVKIVQTP